MDLGVIKIGTSKTAVIEIPDGSYIFKPACGSCTSIKGFDKGKLTFVFTPTSTGHQVKNIYVQDANTQQLKHTISFSAEVTA